MPRKGKQSDRPVETVFVPGKRIGWLKQVLGEEGTPHTIKRTKGGYNVSTPVSEAASNVLGYRARGRRQAKKGSFEIIYLLEEIGGYLVLLGISIFCVFLFGIGNLDQVFLLLFGGNTSNPIFLVRDIAWLLITIFVIYILTKLGGKPKGGMTATILLMRIMWVGLMTVMFGTLFMFYTGIW